MTNITTISRAQARALTKRIADGVESVVTLLRQAYDKKAWAALGYPSWEQYVKAEIGISRGRSYQILDQSKVIEAVRQASGMSTTVDISERDARDVKPKLPALQQAIRDRVAKGESAAEVIDDEIEKARAEKAAKKAARKTQQAEFDRQRDEARAKLPEPIKRVEAAKAKARRGDRTSPITDAERVLELEEAMRLLEQEVVTLRSENEVFAPMKAQWDKGGFEAVVAGRDEQIRVLRTQVETESRDKAVWMSRAAFWKTKAMEMGFSDDVTIPLDGAAVQ